MRFSESTGNPAIHLWHALISAGAAVHISPPHSLEKTAQHISPATLQRLLRDSGTIHRYILLPTKDLDRR